MRYVPSVAILAVCLAAPALAQTDSGAMPGMTMPPQGSSEPSTAADASTPSDNAMGGMPGMEMDAMMMGATGAYSMMRDASGTSWQPDSTPMEGLDGTLGGWATMLHGYVDAIYDHQGGPRGASMSFSESMLMAMAQKQLGAGALTLRTMISLDPFMGKRGYPLLLQTGETANGIAPLIDRQHPHDLFMELAGVYALPLDDTRSVFLYAGYPGEPALGPPTFMHRFSGMDDPTAPITHHWLDATHITYGVVTAGFVDGDWKIEASLFNGREPDQFRWDFDSARLNSASIRVSWNPTPNWALQASTGFIKSPEQLEPTVNQHRTTASASYNLPLAHGNWQTTFAWGRNSFQPGPDLDGFLLESAVSWYRNTVFARAENAEKNELFTPPSPLAGRIFRVSTLSLGDVYDIPVADHVQLGFGAMGSLDVLPSTLHGAYGATPLSYVLFTRVKLAEEQP